MNTGYLNIYTPIHIICVCTKCRYTFCCRTWHCTEHPETGMTVSVFCRASDFTESSPVTGSMSSTHFAMSNSNEHTKSCLKALLLHLFLKWILKMSRLKTAAKYVKYEDK